MTTLGVGISLAKSHVSETTLEFAKRIFHKGVEISPFPLSALGETASRSYLLADLLCEQLRRGWALSSVESSIAMFYQTVFAANSRFTTKVRDVGWVVSSLASAIKGIDSGGKFLNEFAARFRIP